MQPDPFIQDPGRPNIDHQAPLDVRFQALAPTLKRYQGQQDALIEILHRAQAFFGYLDPDLLHYVAHSLRLPLSRVYGVATFYHLFSLEPKGAHTCIVCTGTACYVEGAGQALAAVEQWAGIQADQTTDDQAFSLLTARCLGTCGNALVTVFDGQIAGHQTPESVLQTVQGWLSHESR